MKENAARGVARDCLTPRSSRLRRRAVRPWQNLVPVYARVSSSPMAVLLLGGWSSWLRIALSDREAEAGGNTHGGVQYEHTTGGSTRPSFSTALRQRSPSTGALATLEKPLIREFLFYPEPSSLEAGGQWPVCGAGASPTEVRCVLHLQAHIVFIVDLSPTHCQAQSALIS